MAEQRMKVRDKKVQKMTKDGLVEENLTDKSSVRVSNRTSDVQMGGKQGEKEVSLVDKSSRQCVAEVHSTDFLSLSRSDLRLNSVYLSVCMQEIPYF